MRTTVRIDDDLLFELRRRASREGRTLSEVVNSALRDSLGARREAVRSFRQRTCDLGRPAFDVAKANAVAAALDDAETIRKLVGSS